MKSNKFLPSTEAIQWAIDQIDSKNKKWYNRIRRWLGFGTISRVNLNAPRFDVTETINMATHMELHGSEGIAK